MQQNQTKPVEFILLALLLLLTAVGLALSACAALGQTALPIIEGITLLLYLAVMLYGFFGFNTAHGNLLRYACLLFGILTALSAVLAGGSQTVMLLQTAGAVLAAYMSGRLAKLRKNRFIIPLVFLLFLAAAFLSGGQAQPVTLPGISPLGAALLLPLLPYNTVILWTAISISYLVRFRQHIAAGKAA